MSNKIYTKTPTHEIYEQVELVYNFFNKRLFNDELPACIITFQRDKNTQGYFAPLRWSNLKGTKTHEIALNTRHFAGRQLIEILQTLVHEQCHLWQFEYGTPSRQGYHNQQWADKMLSIGLTPSSNGKPGGATIGQKMSDYPTVGGHFEMACTDLVKDGFALNWIDRRVTICCAANRALTNKGTPSGSTSHDLLRSKLMDIAELFEIQQTSETQRKNKLKVKYHCECCGTNIWGKPSLVIRCEKCQILFTPQLPYQAKTHNTLAPASLAA